MTAHAPPPRLLILRHAPLAMPGLAGRRDVDADCSDLAALDWAARQLRDAGAVWASPALRCRQTAEALGLSPDWHPAVSSSIRATLQLVHYRILHVSLAHCFVSTAGAGNAGQLSCDLHQAADGFPYFSIGGISFTPGCFSNAKNRVS